MTDDLVERVAKAMCGCEGVCFTSCGTEPCQMAEENYAKAARAAIVVVLEEAAKVAEMFPAYRHGNLAANPYAAAQQASDEIAAAIRAMKGDA